MIRVDVTALGDELDTWQVEIERLEADAEGYAKGSTDYVRARALAAGLRLAHTDMLRVLAEAGR